ncbi:hypothetical protein D3C80_1067720 [compost metagenome]
MRVAFDEIKELLWFHALFAPFLLFDSSAVTELVAVRLVPVQFSDDPVQCAR